jgi:hypothetical protein
MLKLPGEEALDQDAPYHVDVHLSYAIRIEMDATLAHQRGQHAGFYCTRIDSDSVAQLKRLVELNLGDSSLLERDMRAMLTPD